jgi:hypothetical protein
MQRVQEEIPMREFRNLSTGIGSPLVAQRHARVSSMASWPRNVAPENLRKWYGKKSSTKQGKHLRSSQIDTKVLSRGSLTSA